MKKIIKLFVSYSYVNHKGQLYNGNCAYNMPIDSEVGITWENLQALHECLKEEIKELGSEPIVLFYKQIA